MTLADSVAGIQRSDGIAGKLRLPTHAATMRLPTRRAATPVHGNSYAAADSNNVHNPVRRRLGGGARCYTCHDAYEPMDTATPATRTSTYHHVMGFTSPPAATWRPGTGATRSRRPDVYCVSCHTDHNYFKRQGREPAHRHRRGRQQHHEHRLHRRRHLRHLRQLPRQRVLAKDNANQRSDGRTRRTQIVGGAAYFGIGSHNYAAQSSYGASTSSARTARSATPTT